MNKFILAAAFVVSTFGSAFAQGNYSVPTQSNADYRGEVRQMITAPISIDLRRADAPVVDRQATPSSLAGHTGN